MGNAAQGQTTIENRVSDRSSLLKSIGWFVLLVAPVAIYYYLLARTWVRVPILDDYDSILAFTNALARDIGIRARIVEIVAWQHNEYKLIFEHSAVAALFAVRGYIAFLPLVIFGNAFVLLIGIVLWLYFREEHNVLVFMPTIYLLFNLQYAEILNWATASLQLLPILAFGLLALWLAARRGPIWLILSSICLVLAEASPGNGFFFFAAGLPMLLRRRAWSHLALWALLTAGMVTVYLFRYYPMPQEPLGGALIHRALFAILFLGGALGNVWIAFPLGLVLWALFIHALWHGYERRRPASFAVMLFLASTAVGVAVTRGAPGLSAEIASRYRIYSCLVLIFAWQYVWDWLSSQPQLREWRPVVAIAAVIAATLFAARSNLIGYRLLVERRADAVQAFYNMRQRLPVPAEPRMQSFFPHAAAVLDESVKTGVYRLLRHP